MKNDTERLILEKAQELFIEKGFSAVRMHEIAALANINKAMLHYYYKTKENLYHAVFQNTFNSYIGQTIEILNSEKSLSEKVPLFVSETMDKLSKNPQIVIFIFNELNKNPDLISEHFGGEGKIDFGHFRVQVAKEYIGTNAEQFFADMVGMCISSIISRSILMKVFKHDDNAYAQFLEERKTHIVNHLLKE